MRVCKVLISCTLLVAGTAFAAPPRFVIDDDEYVSKIVSGSAKLLAEGKLMSVDALRAQPGTNAVALQSSPLFHQKVKPPDLCDRLRESTLAVGSYYKCPDCAEWHFDGSAGFVVGAGGVICTCWHVVSAEQEGVKEGYLVAADAAGRVFPVKSVLVADPESDTCFLKTDAAGFKPLPIRGGVRVGEPVYCLSHPGGCYFMFTQGMVARVNRRCNEMLDAHGQTNGVLTRPILLLNVTAEFAPGSSGAPVVDEVGNVVGQVASITDVGEPNTGDTNAPASPSVPVRFCTAAEEVLRLASPGPRPKPEFRPAVTARHRGEKSKSGRAPKSEGEPKPGS